MSDSPNNGKIQRTGSNRSKKDKGVAADGGAADKPSTTAAERKNRKTKKIYVSNIPYKIRQQDLKDLFSEIGEVETIELFIDEEIKPRGCGLIEFKDQECVAIAVEKFNKHDIDGRKILVREDNGEERDKFGRTKAQGKKMNQGCVDQSSYNTYGLNTAFLDRLGIEGPLLNRIFVSNLDFKVDVKKLTQIFKMAGKIMDVEMGTDHEGNSRGFAIIEFEHPVEAVQAISMFDRQLLYERRMFVRLDKKADRNENLKFLDGLGGIGRGLGPNGKPLKNISATLQQTPPVRHGMNANPAVPAAGLLGPGPGAGDGLGGISGTGNMDALSNLLSVAASLNSLGLNLNSGQSSNIDLANAASLKSLAQKQLNNGALNLAAGKMSGMSANNNDNLLQLLGQHQADLNGLGGSGKKSETIVIKNLPLNYSWKILRDKCSYIGDVKHTKIQNPDFGLVRFNTVREAEKAVQVLDGARFDGRTINVSFL